MKTPYDWITVGIFAGLIVLFMQRSTNKSEKPHDPLWMYIAAGAGCAVANYVGNKGFQIPAITVVLLTVGFILYFLKPFSSSKSL